MTRRRQHFRTWATLISVVLGIVFAFDSHADASTPRDEFDSGIAEHPYIGKLYAHSFKAGIRLPQEFRGEWSFDKKYCGIDGDDYDSRIWIKAVTVHFYDETHVVTGIQKIGPHTLKLTYGPAVKEYHYLVPPRFISLSTDGKTLFGWDKPGEKRQGGWEKCPTGAK